MDTLDVKWRELDFTSLLSSALFFTTGLSLEPRDVANVLYHLADFFSIQIFFGKKTQTNDSDVGRKSGSGSESGSGMVQIQLPNLCQDKFGKNPDQFSSSIVVINSDPSKNSVMNQDRVTTPDTISKPDPVTKLDPRTNPAMDPGLAPNPFTNPDSKP
jgi:hypothetical protein